MAQRPVIPAQRPRPIPQHKKAQRRRAQPALTTVRSGLPEGLEEAPQVLESEIGKGVTPASPARREAEARLSGVGLRLTSELLRQQFILTEILQPPLALREHP
jgi:hypothetical protein